MNIGTALGWIGGWLITAVMALLISFVSDARIPWWWALVAILAFDVVRWFLKTIYAQALWSFFFKRPTIRGIKDALRNDRMPKFEKVKDAKEYYEWICESGPSDTDRHGNLISLHARISATKVLAFWEALFTSGELIAWNRVRSAHDAAVESHINSPHAAPQEELSLDDFLEKMNPGSPFNIPPAN